MIGLAKDHHKYKNYESLEHYLELKTNTGDGTPICGQYIIGKHD